MKATKQRKRYPHIFLPRLLTLAPTPPQPFDVKVSPKIRVLNAERMCSYESRGDIMTTKTNLVLFLFSSVLFNLLTTFPRIAMAIEEPEFKIISKNEKYEIRDYKATLIAETAVESDFDGAGNKAFRILADFIFGNNISKTKISMTAPVTQQAAAPSSEKIAMTAPVTQEKTEQGYVVSFTMPAEFTEATLPQPKDNRVKIRLVPARKVAVYSYSGSWSQEKYNEKLSEFKDLLSAQQVRVKGQPVFARFNSPWALWFLRRNEIWWELEP